MGGHNDIRERLCIIPNTKQIEKKNRGVVVTRNKYLRRENNMIENSDNDRVRRLRGGPPVKDESKLKSR
jgi:hypothetical protein